MPVDMNALIRVLRSYSQADEEGVMVLVSRQACDEAARELERYASAQKAPPTEPRVGDYSLRNFLRIPHTSPWMLEAADYIDKLEALALSPQGRGEEALGPVGDLLLYWQGRANALRILDKARDKSDAATLWQADAFEDCATELRAWFKCPSEDRPSAEALAWRLAAIASDDRK